MADNQHGATAEFNAALKAAFEEGKYDELAAFYTADTVMLPPRGRMLEGRSAVSAFWRGVKTRFSAMVFTTTSLKTLGDAATREAGTYATIAADGVQSAPDGKYVFVWQIVDGDWQIESSIWNRNGTTDQAQRQGGQGQGQVQGHGQRRGGGQGGQAGGGQRRQGGGQGGGGQGGGYRQGGGGYRQGGQGGGYRQGAPAGRPSFQGSGGIGGGGRRGGPGGQRRGGGQGGQGGGGQGGGLYDQGGGLYSDLKD